MTSNEPHSDVRYVSVGQTCVLASNGMPRQVDRMLGMAILFNHVRSTAAEPCRPVSLHPGQSRTSRAPGPSTRQDRQHDNPTAASNHGSSAAMGSSTYGNRYLLTTNANANATRRSTIVGFLRVSSYFDRIVRQWHWPVDY